MPPKFTLDPRQTAGSGARTPRKVQWLDEQSPSDSSTHILDPAGEDPEAFNALVDALEQHRRAAPAATPLSKIHYYSPRFLEDSPSGIGNNEDEECVGADDADDTEVRGASTLVSPTSKMPLPKRGMLDTESIPEDEDAGLPRSRTSDWYAKHQAKRIVQAHTRKSDQHQSHRLPRTRIHHGTMPSITEGSHRDLEHNEPDREGEFEHGQGILSALLQLYDHQGSDLSSCLSSAPSSGISSGRETPLSEGWQSDSQIELQDFRPHADKVQSHKQGYGGHGSFDDRSRKWPRIPLPHLNIPSLGIVSRPPQARTSAGVLGPLIAATGNLGGVAAPHHSQLQPNLNHPGYRLSRYTADKIATPSPIHDPSKPEQTNESGRFSPAFTDNAASASSSTLSLQFDPKKHRVPRVPSLTSLCSSWYKSGQTTPRSNTPMSDSERLSVHPKKKRLHRRRKSEVFITRHVAQIIQREDFLLKLTRAMMMFGAPSHRLQSQIQSAARVLDIHLSFLYFPDLALISFDDASTGTSHIKFIRQPSSLDLAKLIYAFHLYWKVIYDKLSVTDASIELDTLMRKPPLYNWWKVIFIGGMCSAAICTVSFGGSFIDAVISFPLGAFLVAIQLLSVRNVLYTHVFEITITMFVSFVAAALASTHKFCYSAVASSSVVLILPGFIVLTGSLELMSRNIVSGSVRLCYAIVYALFLGFGFAMGARFFEILTGTKVYGAEDYICSVTHNPAGPWYQQTPTEYWAFLTVPMFSLFLSLKSQAPLNRKETFVLVAIACVGWVTNRFTGLKFKGQSDVIAAVGAFAVSLISNIYARIFSGNAFVVMITGILFQLPSGLGSGGLLSYATEQAAGSTTSYISGFRTALKLVSVAIGLAIGLGLALVVAHPIQSRRREAGIFSL